MTRICLQLKRVLLHMMLNRFSRPVAQSALLDRRFLLVLLLLAGSIACAPKPTRVAKIAGRVTLDGKPLPKASVTFVPMATKENPNPGQTAQGMTDEEGRYRVSIDPATPGAVVGTCRIYISTVDPASPGGEDRDAGGPIRKRVDRVPAKYNMATELTFDVPPAGTDSANFDLTSN
jgi:hypothetical protein